MKNSHIKMASLFLPLFSPSSIPLMFPLPHKFLISSSITIITFISKYKHTIRVHLTYSVYFVVFMCTCVHGWPLGIGYYMEKLPLWAMYSYSFSCHWPFITLPLGMGPRHLDSQTLWLGRTTDYSSVSFNTTRVFLLIL